MKTEIVVLTVCVEVDKGTDKNKVSKCLYFRNKDNLPPKWWVANLEATVIDSGPLTVDLD